MLIDKYKVGRDDWFILDHNYTYSRLWKSILFVMTEFMQWIRYRAHDGKCIKFWHDGVGKLLCSVVFLVFFGRIGVLGPL